MAVGRRVPTEAIAPERRRVLRLVEILNVGFLVVEVAIYGWSNLPVVAGRLLVAGALLAADGVLSKIQDARMLRGALVAATLALVAGFVVLVAGTGGAGSPYLAFLAFVPIVLTIAIPDEPAVTLVAGVAGTAAGVGFGVAAGHSPARLGFVLAAFGSCAVYGTASALLYRRMRARETAASAEREQAIADLVASERGRLEADRLAAVGRLAAGFGHDVNNPLASASSNLRFVRDQLVRERLDPEVLAALQDAHEALERIRRMVADLRSLALEAGGDIADADVAEALDQAYRLTSVRLGARGTAEWRVPRDLPTVRASPQHLAKVLSLLMDAAGAHALAGAGEPGSVAVSAAAVDDGVRVVIEERTEARSRWKARSSTPLARSRSELALALCRELAARWGGRIDVAVDGDGAASYALTLPAAPARALVATRAGR
jgi:signal transduction histidine kinase